MKEHTTYINSHLHSSGIYFYMKLLVYYRCILKETHTFKFYSYAGKTLGNS
jgi:hypothetical protein